jgi:2-polyprenyl-6-methoxyphenol hydroxylase-like FAD-dependent oxidoreductase
MSEILIAGGGIGGLALAQGLRRAGVPVRVFERTRERTDWLQGYRIHINPHGANALRDCLGPEGFRSFLDTVSGGGGGIAFMTEKMSTLLAFPGDLFDGHYGVSRIELRRVLLDGLEGIVEFGKSFIGYQIAPDGQVTAQFGDGTTATGDLLVGADGANSSVRGQLLPHAQRMDAGVYAIAGKYPWSQGGLAPELTERSNIVVPGRRGFMFTAMWAGEDAYTFWAYADASERLAGIESLDGAALREVVLGKIRGWAPELRRLVGECDPETVNFVRVRSATPVKPWQTGPVTLLGDAIHNMTPMAGIGANAALRDADLLRRKLIDVHGGLLEMRDAVADYERQMLDYGFAAVKRSLRNAQQARSANPLGRRLFRGFLRAASATPPLRKAMAAGLGD